MRAAGAAHAALGAVHAGEQAGLRRQPAPQPLPGRPLRPQAARLSAWPDAARGVAALLCRQHQGLLHPLTQQGSHQRVER